MAKSRVIDLFSGIGGFALGLEKTGGYETIRFCEINEYCRRVLAKHWPDVSCNDDVTTVEFERGEADVITAGFPCQDVSFAGTGAGLAGERSGLYRHVIRAIRLVRPARAVLENVAALLSRGLGTVLGDLAEIGYDAEWHCIPASAVGAPHRRDRVWIIADAGGDRPPLSGALAAQLFAAHSYAESERRGEARQHQCEQPAERVGGLREEISDSEVFGQSPGWDVKGSRGQPGQSIGSSWWAVEPDVGRVAYGVPGGAHRIAALGNAVVPQIPEIIGRAILATQGAA